MHETIVVGHQPQYLPYLGILNKISRADIYIVVDHVQFVKKYFHNRTYIKVNDKALLLTIPVFTKGQYQSSISEIKIDYETSWIKKHLKTILFAYKKTSFFNHYYPLIEEIYNKKPLMLAEFTSELLVFFLKEFELVRDIRYSSRMNISGHKTELLVNLTKAVNGTFYISGEGAKEYFDEAFFKSHNLKHAFNLFSHPVYPQLGQNFLENMGCIDLLFNCGKDGRKYICNNINDLKKE